MTRPASIWIDLDNSPHVPFFKPIIRELEARGHAVHVSARAAFQVCDLADMHQLSYVKVGRHHGKNPLRKIVGLIWRSIQLLPFALRTKPGIALSHGSRAQILLCNLLRIPTVMIMDYEHARTPLLLRPRWEIVPSALASERLQCRHRDRILTYEGIKEDVYVPEFRPESRPPVALRADRDAVVVTVRPPATEAHYHRRESEELFVEFMNWACSRRDVQVVLLPRNKAQEHDLRTFWPQWFEGGRVLVPAGPVDGLSLLWFSDLVVSGGGTMNREAAALGLPVYSIFRGPIGAIDRQLQEQGRLVLIENVAQVRQRIVIKRRLRSDAAAPARASHSNALATLLRHIEAICERERATNSATDLRGAN